MNGDYATPASGTLILAIVSYLGAMLMAGLLSAFFRISGLHRNGLLEPERLGRVLRDALAASRRFQVTVGSLYLILTVLGVLAWGRLLAAAWSGSLGPRFHVIFVLLVVLAWTMGGVLFKMMAAGTALAYGRVVATLITPLVWLLRPWTMLLLGVMDRLDDTLWAAEAQPLLSNGEIRSLIQDSEGEVDLDADEREMIHSIFTFHDTAVREIMVPRIDMVALDAATPIDEVIATVNSCHHSRIPVYEGSIDKVVGVLYSKDLLNLIEAGRLVTGDRTPADLIRPAYFIPESKKIDEVLDEFRDKRIHVAVVIDEYGGTAGLVTLEDVLEEIVGEIEDEFDEEESLFEWLDARTLRVDPKIDLEEFAELLGITLAVADDESSETLGGLIYEAAGNVPAPGDVVTVAGLEVTVESVLDNRILLAVVRAPEDLPGYARREVAAPPDQEG